jgi:hypothetical protein
LNPTVGYFVLECSKSNSCQVYNVSAAIILRDLVGEKVSSNCLNHLNKIHIKYLSVQPNNNRIYTRPEKSGKVMESENRPKSHGKM